MARQYLLLTLMLITSVLPCAARRRGGQADIFLNPAAPQNCEENIYSMEVLAARMLEQTRDDRVLIAVARLGTGEQSREISRRRLYNVREFLKDRGRIQAEKIVVTEGERVSGFGRVEFYLGGKKVGSLPLARNKDLCLICCDEYGPYYPHKDNSENKKRVGGRRRVPSKGHPPIGH